MAKIAVELERALVLRREEETPGRTMPRILAQGDGWAVADVLCTSGPQDRPFEEQHTQYSISVVLAGSFQYRSSLGHGLMLPGSLMFGNPGQCFECGHEHGEGDRCVAFWYAADYFERLLTGAGRSRHGNDFNVARLPPVRPLAALVARLGAGVIDPRDVSWEELGIRLAASASSVAAGMSFDSNRVMPNAEARVTQTVRTIDRHPDAPLTLGQLARECGLSPYHFLRTFECLTGLTPHQYVRRTRLREAAMRLAAESGKVLDIALDSGFGDVSNFNRAFRSEFGMSPTVYRKSL